MFLQSRKKIITSESDFIFNKPLEEGVKSAFMTTLTDIIYRNQKSYKSHKSFVVKVCKEELFTANIVMYFRKNYFLKETVNGKLDELSTAGLLKFFTQKFADMRFYNLKTEGVGPRSLQLQHLFGILNIWLLGCGISLVFFVFEISAALTKRAFRVADIDRLQFSYEDDEVRIEGE